MEDPTENIRRAMVADINNNIPSEEELARKVLEEIHGKDGVWDTTQLQETFEVIGFLAPFVVVKHKATGKKGACLFSHNPRFYFNYVED
jgi:hypothetical protein